MPMQYHQYTDTPYVWRNKRSPQILQISHTSQCHRCHKSTVREQLACCKLTLIKQTAALVEQSFLFQNSIQFWSIRFFTLLTMASLMVSGDGGKTTWSLHSNHYTIPEFSCFCLIQPIKNCYSIKIAWIFFFTKKRQGTCNKLIVNIEYTFYYSISGLHFCTCTTTLNSFLVRLFTVTIIVGQ